MVIYFFHKKFTLVFSLKQIFVKINLRSMKVFRITSLIFLGWHLNTMFWNFKVKRFIFFSSYLKKFIMLIKKGQCISTCCRSKSCHRHPPLRSHNHNFCLCSLSALHHGATLSTTQNTERRASFDARKRSPHPHANLQRKFNSVTSWKNCHQYANRFDFNQISTWQEKSLV